MDTVTYMGSKVSVESGDIVMSKAREADGRVTLRRKGSWVAEVAFVGLEEPITESMWCRSWLSEAISQETAVVVGVRADGGVDKGYQ